MLLSTECFRWFAFLPFIPFKIWNEVLQPAFLAPSSQNIFSLRSFYFQWGKNEVYVEIRHSHYSTPKAEKMTSSHLLHTPRGSQPRQECATCEAFHGMSRERNWVLTVFRKAEHSRGWRRLQRSPGRENDTLNWDQRYQSVYLEWQGNSHFSGAFSFWDKGLASLLFNIHSPSDYDVKHGSPNLSYCTKGKNSSRWLVLITPQFKRCSSPKGRSRAHLVNQVHVRLRVAVNTEPRDIGREPRTVPKTLSVVDVLSF